MMITVFGPNLRDQSKGEFHVHDSECGDCRRYGPGKEMGGEEGLTLLVLSRGEVVRYLYADQIAEGANPMDCYRLVHFAPCTKQGGFI